MTLGLPSARTLRQPGELAALIREIKDAVAAGSLRQVAASSPFGTDIDIRDLAEHGPWPDSLEMRFDVLGSAGRYKLAVETHHGAGGTWAPE